MTTMTGYALGAPCWLELASSDATAARAFWTALMQWTAVDTTLPDGGVYTRFQLEGRDVAACGGLGAAERERGVPSHWNLYFAVEDVDARCALAAAAGARVLAGPFDVMDQGRMAVLSDPEGAAFRLWQPRAHPGAGAVHEERAAGWVELATRDAARAAACYGRLLGWSVREQPQHVAGAYRIWSVDRYDWGGLLPMDAQWGDARAHWSVYWRVGDCTAAAARVAELGGKVVTAPFDAAGVGRIAAIEDPSGARCYLVRFGGAT